MTPLTWSQISDIWKESKKPLEFPAYKAPEPTEVHQDDVILQVIPTVHTDSVFIIVPERYWRDGRLPAGIMRAVELTWELPQTQFRSLLEET